MQQSGSSLGQQTMMGVVILLVGAFAAGYFVGHGQLGGAGGLVSGGSDKDLACWFSPRGGCTDAVVGEIERASKTIQVQSYSFTSKPIASALIDAFHRGVVVTVVADKSEDHDERSQIIALKRAGIPVFIDAKHAIAHNKVMVIDANTVITGSFNFTHAAEFENADNVLVIHNHPAIATAYANNFAEHLSHSDPFRGN